MVVVGGECMVVVLSLWWSTVLSGAESSSAFPEMPHCIWFRARPRHDVIGGWGGVEVGEVVCVGVCGGVCKGCVWWCV